MFHLLHFLMANPLVKSVTLIIKKKKNLIAKFLKQEYHYYKLCKIFSKFCHSHSELTLVLLNPVYTLPLQTV